VSLSADDRLFTALGLRRVVAGIRSSTATSPSSSIVSFQNWTRNIGDLVAYFSKAVVNDVVTFGFMATILDLALC